MNLAGEVVFVFFLIVKRVCVRVRAVTGVKNPEPIQEYITLIKQKQKLGIFPFFL